MANVRFRGDAQNVAQVRHYQLGGTWVADDTITITINTKTVVYTVVTGSTTITAIIAALKALLAASTIAEFKEITWTEDGTDKVVATAATAGNPFTATASKSSTAGTVTTTDPTGSAGAKTLENNNMSSGAVPAANDTLVFENSPTNIENGLTFLSNNLDFCIFEASYTGRVGRFMKSGITSGYYEYRARELTLDCDTLIIGIGEGKGSDMMAINHGSVVTTVKIHKSAQSQVDGLHAIRIRGTHANNTLEVAGNATVDIAPEFDHSATYATVTVGGTAKVRISDVSTIGTLNVSGSAEVTIDQKASLADITAINISGSGKVILTGDNGITTVEITGSGLLDDRGEGTIANLRKSPNGQYTTENSTVAAGARVITNTTLEAGQGKFDDKEEKVTFTNAIDFGYANPFTDFQNMNLGAGIDLQKS